MSNLRDIAVRIPDRVRSQRLLVDADPIGKAVSSPNDPAMQLLMAVWYEFVEPHGNMNLNCPYCRENVLTNMRAIVPVLLELERDYQTLLQL